MSTTSSPRHLARLVVAVVVPALAAVACGSFTGESASASADGGSSSSNGGGATVGCGAAGVCTGGQVCCIDGDDGPITCTDTAHCTAAQDVRASCDDSADCSDGKVCCLLLQSGFKGIGSSCVPAASCPADDAHRRLCDSARSGECGPTEGCVTLRDAVSNSFWRLAASACK